MSASCSGAFSQEENSEVNPEDVLCILRERISAGCSINCELEAYSCSASVGLYYEYIKQAIQKGPACVTITKCNKDRVQAELIIERGTGLTTQRIKVVVVVFRPPSQFQIITEISELQ